MALSIASNLASQTAHRNLFQNSAALAESFNRLSSGFRINSARDDAAGLAISESLRIQIRSFTVAERNAGDAISMAQTAEGALGEVHGILGRMREIAVQGANGSLSSTDRTYLEEEFDALQAEITRIQGSAQFNGQQVVSETASVVTFQIGLDNTAADQLTLTFGGVALTSVINSIGITGSSTSNALAALSVVDAAVTIVSGARARFGAAMNRMDVAISTIQTSRLNVSAANARIRDVDVGDETSRLARNQVLTQAGISVLAQANQLPQLAFGLIG